MAEIGLPDQRTAPVMHPKPSARTVHTRAKGVAPMVFSNVRRLVRTLAMVAGVAVLAAAAPASADGWHHHYGGYGWGHHYGYGRGWYGRPYGWGIGPRWGWGGGPVYAPPPVVAPAPYYGAPAYPYGYPGGYGGGYWRPGVQLYFGPHFGVGF